MTTTPFAKCSSTTLDWWRHSGLVYFIAAGETPKAIKIGMVATTGAWDAWVTITRRISQLQSANHKRLILLGVILFDQGEYPTRDAGIAEAALHAKFDHLRRFNNYSRGAEWFNVSQELIDYIELESIKPRARELSAGSPQVAVAGWVA
jgi:hypothetical protein